MAILIANDGDRTVNTVADRDAITARFDGMVVTVLDSIADVLTGGGEAGYQWNATFSKWMLIWKSSKDNLNFITEEMTIVDGKVTTTYLPTSNLVWNCYVMEDSLVVAEITGPSIVDKVLNLGVNTYDGKLLTFTYGYGMIEAAVYGASDRAWFIKSDNYTAAAGDRIMADTLGGSFTITLPASPQVGMWVKIADYQSKFAVNPLTINPNGSVITGAASDILLDMNDYPIMLVYMGADRGWVYGT